MPAPRKSGIDYYPASVDMLQDAKFNPLRVRYGVVAIIVYQAILSLCFRDKGYYIDYNDPDSVLLTISQYTAGRYAPTIETIADIINALAPCGLISGELLQGGVITSRAIQRTFYAATAARKCPAVDFSIWLLSESEMREINERSKILEAWVNFKKTAVNSKLTGVNSEFIPYSTQESTRESTQERNADREENTVESVENFAEFWDSYPRQIGRAKALEAFREACPDDETFADVMTGLATWKASRQWQTEGGRYVPAPAKFLMERYWTKSTRRLKHD